MQHRAIGHPAPFEPRLAAAIPQLQQKLQDGHDLVIASRYLGSAAGLGYRIAQAEGTFDVTGVFDLRRVLRKMS